MARPLGMTCPFMLLAQVHTGHTSQQTTNTFNVAISVLERGQTRKYSTFNQKMSLKQSKHLDKLEILREIQAEAKCGGWERVS